MTGPIVEQLREHLQQGGIELTELSDGTSVLLDLAGHQVLALNKAGTLLSRTLLAPGSDKDDLLGALTDAFQVEADIAKADVDEFLNTLAATLKVHL